MPATQMATKKKAKTEGPNKQIGLRLSGDEYARLEKLSSLLPVSTVARVAMLVGLDLLEKQPGILLGETPKRR